MIKAVLFDLDGTLLPMDEPAFIAKYAKLITEKFESLGYEYNEVNKVLWNAVVEIYKSTGEKLNSEVYWDYLTNHYGKDFLKEKTAMIEFFKNEYNEVYTEFYPNPLAKDIVKFVKGNNLLCILATQPVFHLEGVTNRMDFVGLEESDFDYITYSDNSRYTKPNPKYFQDILDKFNLKGEEVLMIGNNSFEDGEAALACNIKTILVDRCLLLDSRSKHEFEIVKMEEIIPTIKKYIEK